ncbi:hypothetical protein LAZ67_4002953 [Cordylochernes scorpioides]|uniref:Transposase n=1 Tax=Cordylochernes scorpioides TaxID=51811 RepID=A0ABY6KGP6_9ARAC|nr:hypothetical protein LAZ67_4002953 [Cordylochernes scorpioides]
MDWPARSPGLNPIEHVWDALERRIGTRHHSPRSLVELRTALLEEWVLLPLDLLQSLVNSMRARYLAPCDFFLFPKLKRPMKGRRYATLDEIKTASKEELKNILNNEFLKCSEDWKNRWHKCIISHGDYFEGSDMKSLYVDIFGEARSVLGLTAALMAAVLVPLCLRGFMQDAELSSVNPQLFPGPGATGQRTVNEDGEHYVDASEVPASFIRTSLDNLVNRLTEALQVTAPRAYVPPMAPIRQKTSSGNGNHPERHRVQVCEAPRASQRGTKKEADFDKLGSSIARAHSDPKMRGTR